MEHNPALARERGIKMSKESMHDFAATKEKGLPEHVPQQQSRKRKYYGQ